MVVPGPAGFRVVQAERRHRGIVRIAVDVRKALAGRQRLRADRRVNHLDLDKRRLPFPVVEQMIAIVEDADPVGLGDRLHYPLPDTEPIAVRHQTKFGKVFQNRPMLLADRQPAHQTSSPKKRWLGAVRTALGTDARAIEGAAATPASPAGIAARPPR